MAQFSKSLFESIKGFGDPISPTDKQEDSKYIQRGTTDRTARRVGGLMEALGMNADYMKTGQERAVAAGQKAAAGAGGLSTKKGLAMSMLAQAKFLQDPIAQQAQVLAAQKLLAEVAEEEKNLKVMKSMENEQKTLIKTARDFGDETTAEQVAVGWLTMDEKSKNDIRKHLRDLELAAVSRGDQLGARLVRFSEAGITVGNNGLYTKADVRNMSQEQADSILSAKHADLKFFTGQDGEEVAARVNKQTGLVENPDFVKGVTGAKQWVNASSLGLTQPPSKSTVVQALDTTGEVSKRLIEMGLESFEELNALAKEGEKSIYQNEESLKLVDEMYTGLAAGIKLDFDRVGKLLASVTGVQYDSSKIVDSQQFTIGRLYEMAIFIKALGSGTGLSDKDAQIAMDAVANNIALEPETIKRVITQFLTTAKFAVEQRDKAAEILKSGAVTNEQMIELMTLTAAPPSGNSAGTTVGRFVVEEI